MILNFASESANDAHESAEGLAAFGINWQALLLQGLTFLLVLFVLKKFVLGKLIAIIDKRQSEIEKGLEAAKKSEQELAKTKESVDKIITEAREQADLIVSGAKKESAELINKAEETAAYRAEAIVAEAQGKLNSDLEKARAELKKDAAKIIAEVSGVILGRKIDSRIDNELIEKELAKRNVE